jgi:hypothetical protein
MSKFISTITLVFIIMLFVPKSALAQSATESGSATDSATSTSSATASDSATTTDTATTSALPDALLETGAHDVLIIFSAGLIFLLAGYTVFSETSKVFNDFE